ncbi:DEKNAAC102144 [Brettanomyces naardenensis]|uniref:DEKNAAC102144 n=1 Tax=Brettanomyces naardenensis TaxID=13370 RepID=A0A448YJS3_BRENA|nr:DEKNAAC102144 [Brettanomyces naardenensis]
MTVLPVLLVPASSSRRWIRPHLRPHLRIVDAKDYVKGLGDYGSHFCGPCVCISNVGYFDLNKGTTEEDFQIDDICFSQTSGVMGSFVNVNVVGFDDGIRMTLDYDTAMPWAEKVPEMAENARRLFNELLSEPKWFSRIEHTDELEEQLSIDARLLINC